MKRSILAIAFLFCFNALFAQEQTLQKLIRQYGIPGMQLIYIKGDQVKSFNLGTISTTSDQKITDSTVFEAASLSKCVFAYTVLRLYDRCLIDLDKPLIDYMGNYNRFD